MGVTDSRVHRIKELLDQLYDIPFLKTCIKNDPIEFPHLYHDPKDIEIAGFIASSLAFGRVELFKPVIRKILSLSGDNLYDYVINFDPVSDVKHFDGLYYRMCRDRDIASLVWMLSVVLRRYGTLGNLFYSCFDAERTIRKALKTFVAILMEVDPTPVYGEGIYPRGLRQLLPSPGNGGPCKRLNMYLRWMVRPADGIDFGLWDKIPPSMLMIPLDTHITRICKGLHMTERKSVSWTMAEEITEKFRLIAPEDPLKYDFALCHLGISGRWKNIRQNQKGAGEAFAILKMHNVESIIRRF